MKQPSGEYLLSLLVKLLADQEGVVIKLETRQETYTAAKEAAGFQAAES